jgi:hypothetical protein
MAAGAGQRTGRGIGCDRRGGQDGGSGYYTRSESEGNLHVGIPRK